MMILCDDNHQEVCFLGDDCPLCKAAEKIEELTDEIEELKDQVKDLEAEIEA